MNNYKVNFKLTVKTWKDGKLLSTDIGECNLDYISDSSENAIHELKKHIFLSYSQNGTVIYSCDTITVTLSFFRITADFIYSDFSADIITN